MPDPITPAAVPPQAPAPATTPAQAPAPQRAAQAAPPDSQKPAAVTPGAPQTPAQGEESKMVPITALHEEREKRQHLQAEMEALRRVAGQNVLFDINGNPVYNQQPQQQQPQHDVRAEIDKMWETDPRRAVQAEIYTAFSWRDQQDAIIDKQENTVATKYPDFDTYRSEVRQYIRTLPLEQRANNGVVEAAYYFVRGQKVDNIIAKSRESYEAELRAKFQSGELAQGMPGGSFSAPPTPQGAVTLTPEQKQAAVAFGIPESEYVKWMKR